MDVNDTQWGWMAASDLSAPMVMHSFPPMMSFLSGPGTEILETVIPFCKDILCLCVCFLFAMLKYSCTINSFTVYDNYKRYGPWVWEVIQNFIRGCFFLLKIWVGSLFWARAPEIWKLRFNFNHKHEWLVNKSVNQTNIPKRDIIWHRWERLIGVLVLQQ